jgi:hypothetical protein
MVLGGTVAGTAAAWAVSTSGAAAATEPADDPISAITADIQAYTADSTHSPDADAEDRADTTGDVQDRREVRTIGDSTEDAGDAAAMSSAVCDFADRAAEHVVDQPCHRVLGSVERVVRDPKDTPQVVERTLTPSQEVQDFGKKVWGLLDPRTGTDLIEQLPELPGLPGDRSGQPALPTPDAAAPEHADFGTGSPEIFTVEIPSAAQDVIGSAVDVAHSFGHSADNTRSAGDDREGNAPVQPVRIPLAPLTAPAAPGGSHGAGHVDGTMFGVSAGSFAAFDDTVIGQIRSGVRHLQVSPGAQPGVTPD